MTNTDKQKKIGAFGVSLLVHGLLLFFIATLTLDLTMPEGTVTSDSMEFTVAPKGSQAETPNVAPVAQPEVPDKVKSRPAPPPPAPTKVAEEPSPAHEDIAPVPVGLPVEDNPPTKLPDKVEDTPDAESKVDSMKAVEETPIEEKPVPQAEPVLVPGNAPTAMAQESGEDPLNLKGQEKVADQSYGRHEGVMDARSLSPFAGNRKPEYPFKARFKEIEGTVIVQLTVNADGTVSDPQIIHSDNEVFNANVLSAVKSWRFHTPVSPGAYTYPFKFGLKGEAQEMKARLRTK